MKQQQRKPKQNIEWIPEKTQTRFTKMPTLICSKDCLAFGKVNASVKVTLHVGQWEALVSLTSVSNSKLIKPDMSVPRNTCHLRKQAKLYLFSYSINIMLCQQKKHPLGTNNETGATNIAS